MLGKISFTVKCRWANKEDDEDKQDKDINIFCKFVFVSLRELFLFNLKIFLLVF